MNKEDSTIIQKIIAESGVFSRREAEALVKDGKVRVNGRLAQVGQMVSREDNIIVKGQELELSKRFLYIKLNKPMGYVCTTRDFDNEKNVFDLVKVSQKLSIVGRLDKDSEGLVLLSNDGDLVNKLTHPRYKVSKVYSVTLSHDLGKSKGDILVKAGKIREAFLSGINLGQEDGLAKAVRVKHLRGRTFEVVLQQGKKRQIRRMFRKLGCHISALKRVRIANITLGKLRKGQWAKLTREEIDGLKKLS